MIDAQLRRYLVRTNLAAAQAIAWAQWHEAWLARIVLPPEEVIGLVNQLSAADQAAHARMIAALPTAETFTAIEDIIERLGQASKWLRAEDPHYVAEVRASLYDSMVALRCGEVEEAHACLLGAHQRLHWVVYERKRDGTHMDRRIRDTALYEQLVGLVKELDELTGKLATARMTVSVA